MKRDFYANLLSFFWLCTSISLLAVPVHVPVHTDYHIVYIPDYMESSLSIMCAPLGLENVHRLNPEISRLLSWRQTTEQQHREFNYVLVDIVPPEGANGAPVPDPRFILGFPAAFF